MRYIGLDIHRDFCEVAICEEGKVRSAGKIKTSREDLELFAGSLGKDDEVALEVTGASLAIARIIKPHVARVILVNAAEVRAISHARVKSDRFDARTLAKLASAGLLPPVWMPDEPTRVLRRYVSRRQQLIKQRTRAKNEVTAVVMRNIFGRPPVTDMFGEKGRAWIKSLELPADERITVEGCLAQIDFIGSQLGPIEKEMAIFVQESEEAKRLMTHPGVGAITSATFMAAVGHIERFESPRSLVGYLGLDPKVRQSGSQVPRYGHISKRGPSQARHKLVEAAWIAVRTPGPLKAFYERIKRRRGAQIAIVAVARKMSVIFWHMLTENQDYLWARNDLVQAKMRSLSLTAGAPKTRRQRGLTHEQSRRLNAQKLAQADLELNRAEQAEAAYRQLVKTRQRTDKEKVRASQ